MDLKSKKMGIKITRLLTVFVIFVFSNTSAQSTLEQEIDEVTITSNRSKYNNAQMFMKLSSYVLKIVYYYQAPSFSPT